MNRSTYSLLLFAALVLSGCNLETVTVAEGKTETKPGPIAAEPAPVTPVPEEPVPAPVVPEPAPTPVVPAPEPDPQPEPVVPAPEPDPQPEPVVPAPEPEPQPEPVVPTPPEEPVAPVEPVEPEEKHSVQLAWDIPMQRENGEALPLYEIGGYKIEYRLENSSETKTVVVDHGLTDETVIPDLLEGWYEFRIAAFDTNGLFSDYSDAALIKVGPNS